MTSSSTYSTRSRMTYRKGLSKALPLALLLSLGPVSHTNGIDNPQPEVIPIIVEVLLPDLHLQNPCIDLDSNAVVPVFVFGSSLLAVSNINLNTIRLAGAAPVHFAGGADRNGDGDVDLLVQFLAKDMVIKEGDTSVLLSGETFDQRFFLGSDSILKPGGSGNCGDQ